MITFLMVCMIVLAAVLISVESRQFAVTETLGRIFRRLDVLENVLGQHAEAPTSVFPAVPSPEPAEEDRAVLDQIRKLEAIEHEITRAEQRRDAVKANLAHDQQQRDALNADLATAQQRRDAINAQLAEVRRLLATLTSAGDRS